MIIDNNLIFDSAAAITTTRDSTNIIDLSQARDIGDGHYLSLIVQVATAPTSTATTTTVTVKFMVSTDNSTYTTAALSDAVTIGSMAIGTNILNVYVPMRRLVLAVSGTGGDQFPRYLKLNYVASATLSAGAFTAWIGDARQTDPGPGYPSGFTVLN
jgi:hypothetical protein